MRALYFKEIKSFLSSIIGYIFILIYLIASGLFHWIISTNTNLLQGSEADLIPFFNLSPVIFLILIPAITMRSIAEERRTGTFRHAFAKVEPRTAVKVELLENNVLQLNNEFMLSYFANGQLYDKTFVFRVNTINEKATADLPIINKRGVFAN